MIELPYFSFGNQTLKMEEFCILNMEIRERPLIQYKGISLYRESHGDLVDRTLVTTPFSSSFFFRHKNMYFLLFLTQMVIVAGPQLRELLKWPRPLPLEDERVRLLHEVKVSLIVLYFQIFSRLAFVFRNLVIDVCLYMYLHAPLLRYKSLK